MKFLRIWWQVRLPRERLMLTCLSILTVFGLVHLSWQQAVAYRENSVQLLVREHQATQMLPEMELALQKRLSSKPAYRSAPGPDTVMTLAQQHGLMLQLMKKGDKWQLQNSVNVDFSRLVAFLTQLETHHGLTASKLQMVREKQHVRLIQLEMKNVK